MAQYPEPVREFVFHGERPHPWEVAYAKTVQDRTQLAGKKAIQLRNEILKLNPLEPPSQAQEEHDDYIHKLGKHALKVQPHVGTAKEVPTNKDGTLRLVPRPVKVDEMEDTGGRKATEMLLEQEWSTVTWTDEMVEAACEALFMRFQEDDFHLRENRRLKGCVMMEKLFNNHRPGDTFVRRILDFCLNSTTSRVLRRGRCTSKWNLLYLVNIAKVRCCTEVTGFGFAGKALEMMMLECRLAAILIQFMHRSQREKERVRREHPGLYKEIRQEQREQAEKVRAELESHRKAGATGGSGETKGDSDEAGSGTRGAPTEAADDSDGDAEPFGSAVAFGSAATKRVAFSAAVGEDKEPDAAAATVDKAPGDGAGGDSVASGAADAAAPGHDPAWPLDEHGRPVHPELAKVLGISKSFGTDKEACRMKMLVIQGRNSDLRFRWAQMQNNQPPNAHHPKGVVRYGPVHINPLHTSIMLEIIAHIVSDKAGPDYAAANREDVVKNNGVIILALYASYPSSQFARHSMQILSYTAKVWQALMPMLNCGTVRHAVRYMRFLRATYKELVCPTKKAAIATPLSPQERYGYSRHDARSPGKATEGSGSGLVEGSVFSDVGPPSGPSSPSRSVTFPVGDKDAHHAAAGESLYSFSVDSGAEFSVSLDLASKADSQLERMRAIEKAREVEEAARGYYMDGVRLVMYLAEHVAGLHRARERVTPDGYVVERSRATATHVANVAAAEKAAKKAAALANSSGRAKIGMAASASTVSAAASKFPSAPEERVGVVDVDYHAALAEVNKVRSGPRGDWDPSAAALVLLGSSDLMTELVGTMVETVHISLMKSLLKCIFILACAEPYSTVVRELVNFGGRALKRLLELLEEDDPWVSGLALGILLQVCTLETGRDALIGAANIPKLLADLLDCGGQYDRLPHQRAMYVSAALCRQQEWWAYAPEELLPLIMPDEAAAAGGNTTAAAAADRSRSKKSTHSDKAAFDPTSLRTSILTDLVRTVKAPDNPFCVNATLADLNVLPINEEAALGLSKTCETVTIRALANYVCRPEYHDYFESLPWDESVAGCCVLEALTLHPGTVDNIFSPGAVFYLSRCLLLSKVLFLGPPMSDRRTVMLLCGVTSATRALTRFCQYCATHPWKEKAQAFARVMRDTDLMTAVRHYIGTLAVSHPMLDEGSKHLQQQMGMSVVRFFSTYAFMLLDADGGDEVAASLPSKSLSLVDTASKASAGSKSLIPPRGGSTEVRTQKVNQQLVELFPSGLAMCQLVKVLPSVHGRGDVMVAILAELCALLQRLTAPKLGAYTALNEWKVMDALRALLPPPLTSVGPLGVHDPLYKTGLGALPPSFFGVCCNLCHMEVFRGPAVTEGFLRRALEQLTFLAPFIERDPHVYLEWRAAVARGEAPPPGCSERQDVRECLNFVAAVANYQTPQSGNSNDLIFLPDYALLPTLRALLAIDECPRTDPLFLAALRCFATLSRDFMRWTGGTNSWFLELHVLEFVLSQLELVEEQPALVPDDVLVGALELLQNMAQGLWSDELAEIMPCAREPLGKVARVRPQFVATVRDVNWAITKATQAFDEQRDARQRRARSRGGSGYGYGYGGDDSVRYINDGPFFAEDDEDEEGRARSGGRRGSRRGSASAQATAPPTPGTYFECGVTACGSLRHEGSAGHTHGAFAGVGDEARAAALTALPMTTADGAYAAVSKLSMKEGGVDLEEKLRRRKIAMGFTDRRAFTADAAGAARALSADGTADNEDGDGERAVNSGRDGLQKYASTGGIFAASAPAALRGPPGKDVSGPHSSTRPGTGNTVGAGDAEGLRPYTPGQGGKVPWGKGDGDDDGDGDGHGLDATAPLFEAPEPRAHPAPKSLRLAQSGAGGRIGAANTNAGSGSGSNQRGRRPRPVQLMTIDADEIPGLAKTRPPPLPAAQRPIVFPPVIAKYQPKQL